MTDLEETLKIQKKNSDVAGQLQTLSQLCQAYQAQRKYQKALIYSRQAVEIVKSQSNTKDKIHAYIDMGCVFWEMAQLKKAMGFFQEALTMTEETQDIVGQQKLSAILGISYWRKGDWITAFSWFERAMPAFKDEKIKSTQSENFDTLRYGGLHVVMERGVATLENRISIAKDQNNAERTLLPSFSMIPLLYFTSRKDTIPALIEEIIPLARQLNKINILDTIPKLKTQFILD